MSNYTSEYLEEITLHAEKQATEHGLPQTVFTNTEVNGHKDAYSHAHSLHNWLSYPDTVSLFTVLPENYFVGW